MSDRERRADLFTADSVPVNYERHLVPAVFDRWARRLVQAAGIEPGAAVLDIACGTGVASRLAAERCGPSGHVTALDISPAMLAHAQGHPPAADAAVIDYVEGSADALGLPDGSVDVVLCQQGLQFFPDRAAAVAEMRRVLRPGGGAVVSVWAAGRRLEPFDDYAEAVREAGVDPPFPRAFENDTFTMPGAAVEELLAGAGFDPVAVTVVEQEIDWSEPEAAVAGILGTPFGPLVSTLTDPDRDAVWRELRRRLAPGADGTVRRTSVAIIARATAPA